MYKEIDNKIINMAINILASSCMCGEDAAERYSDKYRENILKHLVA
jgi:hypothetical protein